MRPYYSNEKVFKITKWDKAEVIRTNHNHYCIEGLRGVMEQKTLLSRDTKLAEHVVKSSWHSSACDGMAITCFVLTNKKTPIRRHRLGSAHSSVFIWGLGEDSY